MWQHDSPPPLDGESHEVEGDPSLEELELAYQRALSAVETIEAGLPPEPVSALKAASPETAFGTPGAELPGPPASPETAGRVTARQVIEAALFVGGGPLTARKLCAVLRDDSDHQFIDRTIEDLNAHYAAQGRPCTIRLGEGGYRMELRSEFEPVRNRVFGYGPKEVRLSQDALETLALVAYRQPLTRDDIEHALQRPAGTIINQLLRRELIAIERGDAATGEVSYRTTPRFLDLFGLSGIHELPQPDDLSFK